MKTSTSRALPSLRRSERRNETGRWAADRRVIEGQLVNPVVPRAAAVLFASILFWGLLHFGATETEWRYTLFLLLLLPALLVLWRRPALLLEPRVLAVLGIGIFLLVRIFTLPTLRAQGYVLLAVGWLALFTTLALAASSTRTAWLLTLLLIVIGGFQALYGLTQVLAGFDYIGDYYRGVGRRATGTLINANHFAGLLNMILPLAVGALFATYPRRVSNRRAHSEVHAWAWLVVFGCSLMALAIFFSLSRAGVACLLLTGLFLGLLLLVGERKGGFRFHTLAVLAVLTLSLCLVLWTGAESLITRFEDVEGDLPLRKGVYEASFKLIGDNLVAGVGPGMYMWHLRPYQSSPADKLYEHAHSDYLETAAEWGVPVAAGFWFFVLWRLKGAITLALKSGDILRRGIALGSVGAIVSIVLHSLVDFNLQIPVNLAVFCSVVGLVWGCELREN